VLGICAAGLAQCRDAGDLQSLPNLLAEMPFLDLQAGRTDDAAAHLREALQIALRTGSRVSVLNGLDQCGHLCAATGRWAETLTMWAAHVVLGRHEGYTDWSAYEALRDEPLRRARQVLGPARARAAEDRGRAMSLATAAEFALMLTAPGPQPAAEPAVGKLSARERGLVTLVARGRTDARRGHLPPGRGDRQGRRNSSTPSTGPVASTHSSGSHECSRQAPAASPRLGAIDQIYGAARGSHT
jgi:hypothetical protein